MQPHREVYDVVYCPLGASAFGGAERSILDLATRFSRRGLRVLMLIGPEMSETGFVRELDYREIPHIPVAWSQHRGPLENARAVFAALSRVDGRVIHLNISWQPWMWLVPLGARILCRGKLIGSMRAMPDPHELVPRRRHFGLIPGLQLWHVPELVVGWLWGRLLLRTVTINAKDFPVRLVSHYRYPPDRIVVIYNGIDPSPQALPPDVRTALRTQAGATSGDLLICFAGRLSSEKGVHHLVAALAKLPRRYKLAVVGDGPQRSDLEAQAAGLGLVDRVYFAGFSDRADRWMAASDVVAVPSTWYEAFGRVVVEAMREGVPVVASRIGGMAELFDDGIQGRFVEPGSVDDLLRVLSEIGGDPERLRRMGDAARRLVAERYSLDRVEQEYLREYERLAGGSFGRPAGQPN